MKLNRKKRYIISILFLFAFFISTIAFQNNTYNNHNNNNSSFEKSEEVHENLRNSNGVVGYWPSEIYIDGSVSGVDAHNWTWAVSQDWCSGLGTASNPYIIKLNITDPNFNGGILNIQYSSAYFIIKDSKFTNSSGYDSYGIRLRNVSNGTIINTECSANSVGITMSDCYNITINGTILSNNGSGINLSNSYNSNITNNTIKNIGYGILISKCENITVFDNIMLGCGISLDENDSQAQMSAHKIEPSNKVNGKSVYYYVNQKGLGENKFLNGGQIILINCSYAVIKDLNIYNTTLGILLYYCDNNTISNCNVTYCYTEGISLKWCKNITIYKNNVSCNNNYGIKVESSDFLNITRNTVNNNGNLLSGYVYSGVYLKNCETCNITNNVAINNTDAGIYLEANNNLNVSGNSIVRGGIYIITYDSKEDLSSYNIDISNTVNGKPIYYYVSQEKLTKNDFSNAGQVFLIACNDSHLENLDISLVYIGIFTSYCSNITFVSCNSSLNYYGFHIRNSINVTVVNCNSSQNTFGFDVINSSNSTFYSNVANNNTYGCSLVICNFLNFTQNRINYNIECGIGIYEGKNNTILSNILINNKKYGIYLSLGANHTLRKNNMINCGLYINPFSIIDNMVNNTIDTSNTVNNKPLYYYIHKIGLGANNFTNAGQIILINCSHCTISNENISSTTFGIGLYHCGNNTIQMNSISLTSQYGLELYYSSHNNITKNLFIKNNEYGIFLNTESQNNSFIMNIFKENKQHVLGGRTTNKWDNGTIGNYWDDYTGYDKNDDGIGDIPYIVTFYYTGIMQIIYVYDNKPIWDDGPEPVILPASEEKDDKKKEEVLPVIIPFGNFYLVFVVLAIITITIYVKKRKTNY